MRGAFRRLLRATHPDVAGGEGGATRRTALLIEAYERLRAAAGVEPAPEPDAPAPVGVTVVDSGTLAFAAPADEVFLCLLEVAHELGEVTYVDPDVGLLETIVQLDAGPTCSLVVSLQGRGTGVTEAFCTLEPIGSILALPATAAVDMVCDRLQWMARPPC